MNFILDTNVVSELVARDADQNVVNWVDSIDSESVFLSVITIGELKKGIERLPDSERKKALESWLEGDLLVRFHGRILYLMKKCCATVVRYSFWLWSGRSFRLGTRTHRQASATCPGLEMSR